MPASSHPPAPDRPALSRLALGAMTFGAQVEQDEAAAMVATARDAGVTTFDTAGNYGAGASEELLGRAVRGCRDEVVLCTKAGNPVQDEDGSTLAGASRRALTRALEASLRRLGTDRVDVFSVHRPDPGTPLEETLEVLRDLVAAGKARHAGTSNHAAWQVAELVTLARERGWPQPLVCQQQYNLLSRRVEAEYEACSARYGLLDVVYNPLAGGLLTGKHRPGSTPSPGTRFTKATYQERYWNRDQFDAVERLQAVAGQAGLSLVELALRWLLARPMVDCVLLGASSLRQLEEDLRAVDGPPLGADVLAACDAVWAGLAGAAPPYAR